LFAFWLHSDSVDWSVCELTFVASWQRQKQQSPANSNKLLPDPKSKHDNYLANVIKKYFT